ncbi:MAG: fructosamine kinase family protein [Streptosporangiaceae bacterium]|jgi:fructosamine-3-kinase
MDDGSARLERLLGCAVRDVRNAGGQHGVRHYRLTLADGRAAFAKLAGDGGEAARAGFAAEASGLRWLAAAGTAAVPEVLGSDDRSLVLAWIAEQTADRNAAARFGRELAALHAAGADAFGAPWPGVIASLPLPNAGGPSWPEWYVSQRVLPYLRLARDAGTLSRADVAVIESAAARVSAAAGPAEPPSRIHGDLWAGNLLWSGGRGWLIDPAAHGGHRETDLAMLALFGAPYLDQILAGYQEAAPLAEGWRQRVPLHQLHPLLVHVCLFGAAYREAALLAAHSTVRLAS